MIDTTDLELQHGELFLIQSCDGPRDRRIIQVRESLWQFHEDGPEEPAWCVGDLAGFRQAGDQCGVRTFTGLCLNTRGMARPQAIA